MPETPAVRPAKRSDVARIVACVSAAYSHYIFRMEKPPAPYDYVTIDDGVIL